MSGRAPKPADQSTPWPHEDVPDTHDDLKRAPDPESDRLDEAIEESFPASDPPAMTQPQPTTTKPGDADTASPRAGNAQADEDTSSAGSGI